MKSNPMRAFALTLILATQVTAFVNNDMFMIGYGIKPACSGSGGIAFTAPRDSLTGATNPTGIADVAIRIDCGYSL